MSRAKPAPSALMIPPPKAMSVEDGAKLVISAGLVSPAEEDGRDVPALTPEAAEQLPAKAKPKPARTTRRKKTTEKVD